MTIPPKDIADDPYEEVHEFGSEHPIRVTLTGRIVPPQPAPPVPRNRTEEAMSGIGAVVSLVIVSLGLAWALVDLWTGGPNVVSLTGALILARLLVALK